MGIGRRLAPLLDGDRRLAELLYALLFSLPGSPFIYYGDELLMGENLYLGDRDSVRTPMQWSPDRNGGFSRADFAQLYLPPLMDPVYGFRGRKRRSAATQPELVLALDPHHAADALAVPRVRYRDFDVVPCANPSVLAYVRSPRPLATTAATAPAQERPSGPGRGAAAGRGGRGTGRGRRRPRGPRQFGPVRPQSESIRPAGGARPGPLGRVARPWNSWADTVPAVGGRNVRGDVGPNGFYWFELIEDLPPSPVTPP